jgi:hypothetical protein
MGVSLWIDVSQAGKGRAIGPTQGRDDDEGSQVRPARGHGVTCILVAHFTDAGGYRLVSDQQLARIRGLDDFSESEPRNDACVRTTLAKGEVFYDACGAAGTGTVCINCPIQPDDSVGKIPNTQSDTGIEEAGGTYACTNWPKFVGECIGGVCTAPIQDGTCQGSPKRYQDQ